MSLPIINVPTYQLVQPSTKEELKYRPFLVKEEKLLLMAMEEESEKQMVNAVRTIVDNCTFQTLEVEKLPMFDLEYIFINIRAKSVGEVASLKLLCEDDGETYADVDVPLDKIEVNFDKDHTNIVELGENIKMEMSYPTFEMAELVTDTTVDNLFKLIEGCVNRIIDGETVYEKTDFSKKELSDFIDSLNSHHFQEVQKFFETMPKLSYKAEYENPKTKVKNSMTLEGLNSFFA